MLLATLGCVEEKAEKEVEEVEEEQKEIQLYFQYCLYSTTWTSRGHYIKTRIIPLDINATCEQKMFALLISKINFHKSKYADLGEISCVWEDYYEGRQFNYCGYDEKYFREGIAEIIHRCEDTNSTGDKS